jgi:hypothetical protein
MPLLCYTVKHFFYIPPTSVVWRRTTSHIKTFRPRRSIWRCKEAVEGTTHNRSYLLLYVIKQEFKNVCVGCLKA